MFLSFNVIATVYIESTIINYLAARPSRDLIVAAHQQITSEWWDSVSPQFDCFISPFVIQEISAGDHQVALYLFIQHKNIDQIIFAREHNAKK